ncbi:protein TPX2 isoform X1 [Hordeum vulgare subsp. vulgare]|uniref:TPX2 C-terminal domain-containing protein n=1 Tax=Hordeum vulgare subsp. vulgare TaxID=112509 RepID=A0A8I6WJU5_HORVV|nr:protein TPX2 isoform X1 [Hordeum vulgare subsp. vulgare]
MAAETKPSSGTEEAAAAVQFQVDEAYEYRAPKYFDFVVDETEDDIRAAERWFQAGASHAPSPFAPRIKESRAEVKIDALCDFADAEDPAPSPKNQAMEEAAVNLTNQAGDVAGTPACPDAMSESPPTEDKEESPKPFEFPVSKDLAAKSADVGSITPNIQRPPPPAEVTTARTTRAKSTVKAEACTPKVQGSSSTRSKTVQPSNLKQSSLALKKKSVIKGARDAVTGKADAAANDIRQENQAVKRQKLDDGSTRQILNVKSRVLPHKGSGSLAGNTEVILSSMRHRHDDAHSLKEVTVTPYISAAEMVKKFESGTRDLGSHYSRSISNEDAATASQRRPKLMLTRPKEPEFQTTHRVRAVRMKSSSELEEEMLAKIPKFRARPFNKKIAEAPSFPPLARTAPQLPEFNEFHLKTMERASRHADTCSEASSVGTLRSQGSKPLKQTEAKPPQLETALRARPSRVKSSQELELEELEKAPKFKAKPLNKRILESKGDIGVFVHPKPQATEPKEFHFRTDDRLGPPAVADLLDKLSLYSESSSYHDKKDMPRLTIPNPFNLHTDERGHDKERQLEAQLLQKKLEEEKARKFKANPYPYTTDYPVVPPKPEAKPCTRPEGFQLESLARHEVEQQRLMEERERMAREEAQRRIVRAQPIMKEDPIPLPQKERKPLTEVQLFELHVDERAVQRSEFDNKMKEKEIAYKRAREENEFAQKIEEEKALKQLRRTLVPQARPLPKFDRPFRPQRSMKQVTRPKSPQLQVNERGARRHPFMR